MNFNKYLFKKGVINEIPDSLESEEDENKRSLLRLSLFLVVLLI